MPIQFPLIDSAEVLHHRQQVMVKTSPVPDVPGVYAWWFRETPIGVDLNGCQCVDGLTLLYVGTSPGRESSKSTLRERIFTHYAGPASRSTLRRSLGCLLSSQLGIGLHCVGSKPRLTLTRSGEQILNEWMAENAYVDWQVMPKPW